MSSPAKGPVKHDDQDWQMAEHQRLAFFRKAQLRELRRLQLEEQKECNQLVVTLRAERETTVSRSWGVGGLFRDVPNA